MTARRIISTIYRLVFWYQLYEYFYEKCSRKFWNKTFAKFPSGFVPTPRLTPALHCRESEKFLKTVERPVAKVKFNERLYSFKAAECRTFSITHASNTSTLENEVLVFVKSDIFHQKRDLNEYKVRELAAF